MAVAKKLCGNPVDDLRWDRLFLETPPLLISDQHGATHNYGDGWTQREVTRIEFWRGQICIEVKVEVEVVDDYTVIPHQLSWACVECKEDFVNADEKPVV
jgi:hypothetical protein